MGLHDELQACLNGERCLESYYLTSWNEDFLNATDCELAVGGEALRAHTAVLAARAPAFSPLLSIDGPRTLRDPFGITSLQHMLLLLRLCYRPEDADGLESAGMLDLLPGLITALHRVGAIGLLGGRQRLLQRGISLSAAASPAQLLALLDASAQLTGMEHFAGACGARLINGLSDAHPTARADGYTGLGFSSLGLLPGLALHSLSAPAKDLLLRAALTVVADARGRGRLRFTAGQAAAQGQAAPPLLAELDRGDLWLMAATAGRCGSFSWDAGTFDAAELEEGPAALLSPVFSIGGHDWRLRLVGLTGELPPDNPWLPVDEDDPEPPAWMLLTLEAANPAALPEQGLEVHMRACLADRRGSEHLSRRQDVLRAAVTRQAPATEVVPLCDRRQLAASCLAASAHQRTYRLRLQLDLGVSHAAPGADDGPDVPI